MSLDARLSLLWIRLQNRFTTSQPLNKEIPRIAESIQPITNVDDLLQQTYVHEAVVSITGTGSKILMAVPSKERWRLLAYYIYLGTGTWSFSSVGALMRSVRTTLAVPTVPTLMQFDVFTSSTGRTQPLLARPLLGPGDQIVTNIDVYTVTGNLYAYILYEKEDAY